MQRDVRLDIVRGWLQLTIFASHVSGSWIGTWLIHGAWGLSDSSEQFVFLSGLTLGSVFDYKLTRYGWSVATRDMLIRTARLYRTHLLVLFGFTALMMALRLSSTLSDEIAMLHWTYWFERPIEASIGAIVLLYQPAFMDILPIFILCMMVLPGFGWLLTRVGGWALLPPILVYTAVELFGLRLPYLGNSSVGFNVLAWQILFMLGAWIGRKTRHGEWQIRRQGFFVGFALLVVVGALAIRLAQHGLLPWHLPMQLDAWFDKRNLAPLRVIHALSVAFLVAFIIPRKAKWMRLRIFVALTSIGKNSLRIFCLGLFLSLACSLVLRVQPYSTWLDFLLIGSGAGLLAAYATLIDWQSRSVISPMRSMEPQSPANT